MEATTETTRPAGVPPEGTRIMLHFDAGNDRNGNPRRAYALYGHDQYGAYLVNAWDEGYAGHRAVPTELQEAARRALSVPTTAQHRRRVLALARRVAINRLDA